MNIPYRSLSLLLVVLLAPLWATTAAVASDNPVVHRDDQGRTVREADGTRILYRLDGTAVRLEPREPVTAPTVHFTPAPRQRAGSRPAWHWAPLGTSIGWAGLHAADLDEDGTPEIIASSSNQYWSVLSLANGENHQLFASRPFHDIFRTLEVARDDHGKFRVFVGAPGQVLIHDGRHLEPLDTIDLGTVEPNRLEVADVDADGAVEVVLIDDHDLFIYNLATGALEIQKLGFGGRDLDLGQIDGDAALEIAIAGLTGSGLVLDGATTAVDWGQASGFGTKVELANVNGAGPDEIITARIQNLTVWEVDSTEPLYEVELEFAVFDAITTADVDGNGSLELLYGEDQFGQIHVLDGATGARLWSVGNPEHGVTAVTVADIDGDNTQEIVWGTGHSTSGPDRLVAADADQRVLEWQSVDLGGPFWGLDYGDLDADGESELLWGTRTSDAGGDGRYLVHAAGSRQLEYLSPPPTNADGTGIWEVAAANLDTDPQLEICITTSIFDAGRIACFDGLSQDEEWHADIPDGITFRSLAIADVDGTGSLEVVAGVGPEFAAPGIYVYAFDGATGALEWRSPDLDSSHLTLLRVADVDGDPVPEVVVAGRHGRPTVLDGATGLIQVGPVDGHEISALDTHDRDGDGKDEIFVAQDDGTVQQLDPTTLQAVETLATYPPPVYGLTFAEVTGDAAPDYVLTSDGRIEVYNGANSELLWRGESWGPYEVGANDSLRIGDVDDDGRPDILLNTWFGVLVTSAQGFVFTDGFESGDLSAWTAATEAR